MNAKATIRKFIFISVWVTIGLGMLTLLIAAIGRKHHERCKDLEVKLRGEENNFFVDANEVQQLLITAAGGAVKGQLISAFNLHHLEQLLEHNVWIKDAELYFTSQDILHVNVTERKPVARVFNSGTGSFYIDSLGMRMPLTERSIARVPVFTGFPEKKTLSKRDSVLLQDISNVARFILHDPFWMAQVSQIDIDEDRNFEMIPVVGDHVVRLGDAQDIEQKFHRLYVFYQQVLSKTGFDKYKTLDVQFAGQVVASQQGGNAKVDSAQLRRNVEKLLKQAQESETDATTTTDVTVNTVSKPDPVPTTDAATKTSANHAAISAEKDGDKTVSAPEKKPELVKTRTNLVVSPAKGPVAAANGKTANHKPTVTKPIVKSGVKKDAGKKAPKAVMPKRDDNKQG